MCNRVKHFFNQNQGHKDVINYSANLPVYEDGFTFKTCREKIIACLVPLAATIPL